MHSHVQCKLLANQMFISIVYFLDQRAARPGGRACFLLGLGIVNVSDQLHFRSTDISVGDLLLNLVASFLPFVYVPIRDEKHEYTVFR